MIDREQLIRAFAFNVAGAKQQTAGLTHEQSLLQLPFRGNCMNWVLGHLVENRSAILVNLGQSPIMTEAEARRYGYGSEPVTCEGEDVLRMEDLLGRFERAQGLIADALRKATPELLAQEVHFIGRTMSMAERLFFQYYHETYHLGQLEQLRQLAGTNDKVV